MFGLIEQKILPLRLNFMVWQAACNGGDGFEYLLSLRRRFLLFQTLEMPFATAVG